MGLAVFVSVWWRRERCGDLVAVPTLLWGLPLTWVWGIMAGICLLAALMMLLMLRRLRSFR